jgi:hypothetical protein
VVLEINYGGQLSQELVLNSIRLLAQEVMPQVQEGHRGLASQ